VRGELWGALTVLYSSSLFSVSTSMAMEFMVHAWREEEVHVRSSNLVAVSDLMEEVDKTSVVGKNHRRNDVQLASALDLQSESPVYVQGQDQTMTLDASSLERKIVEKYLTGCVE